MSKKDYEGIAEIIKCVGWRMSSSDNISDFERLLCKALAVKFEQSNPLFKKGLFLKLCGVENDR